MQSGQLNSDNRPDSISSNDSKINEIMTAGDKYLTSGDQLNAQKKYGDILAILSENKQDDNLIAGRTHKKMGDSFRDLGDQVKAKERYLVALEILKKYESDLEVTFDMLIIQGNISHISRDLPNAKELYEKALAILDKLPTDKNQDKARTLRKIGDVHRDLGNYDDAILCYQRDLALSKDELEIASTFRKLGYIYQCKNDFSQAKDYYEQALKIKRKHSANNKMTLVNILNCLGSLYVNLNEIDMAIAVLKESIDIIRDKEHLADSNNRYMEFALKWLAKAESIHSSKSSPETKQIQHETVTTSTLSTQSSIKKMPIIFIAGPASEQVKKLYVKALSEKMSNCVYLNINNLINTFSKPLTSKFTDQYTDEQRIKIPSHEVILGLTNDNLPLNKVVMLDGNIDFNLVGTIIKKQFPALSESNIKVLYLHDLSDDSLNIPSSIKALAKDQVIAVDTTKDEILNIQAMTDFITDKVEPEKNASNQTTLVMSAGLAGVGKTTHLRPICVQIPNSIYLDTDIATFPFLNSVNQSLVSDYYGIHVRNQRYEVMFKFALDNLNLNKTAILDGCFGDKLTGTLVKNCLKMPNFITTAIYFHCSGASQLARIVERNAERDAEKLKDLPSDRRNNLEKHLAELAQTSNVLYVDTEQRADKDKNIAGIFDYLTSPDLQSIVVPERKAPLDKSICKITVEEAQGDLSKFDVLLDRVIQSDQHRKETPLGSESPKVVVPKDISRLSLPVSLSSDRNSVWAKQNEKQEVSAYSSVALTLRGTTS